MNRAFGGRYEVEGLIGAGGMGNVWRGHDRTLNRTVAIKTLLPEFARNASYVHRFRREAQVAARLNHSGIVSVHDSGTDGDTPYIVMEHVEGRTLADFLESGRTLPPMQAAMIAQEVAAALAAAHAQGVIHRDIKPANVMITREGRVMVMDFGIARLIGGPEVAPQTRAVMGTASYLSPEQAQGQPVDGRTDIYSLGIVLYEMLTGRPPFTGDSPMAIAYKQVNATPIAPRTANADVSPQMDAVVMRALSKNPANRCQTAQEFADDLERVRTGTSRPGTRRRQEHRASVVIREDGGERTVWLASDTVTIGRLADCEVVLKDKGASRKHAQLTFRNGAWTVTDLGTLNGTRLNGQTIQSNELANGDKITIAATAIEFRSTTRTSDQTKPWWRRLKTFGTFLVGVAVVATVLLTWFLLK